MREVSRDTLPQNEAPIHRPTVRVVVLDQDDRTLLFSSHDGVGRVFWYTPGGAALDGESPQDTASRELREETGLTNVVVTTELWRREVIATWGGQTYDCRERYFLLRTPAFSVDTAGFTDKERQSIVEHRWWTIDELLKAQDTVYPIGLAVRLAELLDEGPPEMPLTLTEG